MATFRSFTGYLNSDLGLPGLPAVGNTFEISATTPTLNIVIQDDDDVIEGDTGGGADNPIDTDQTVFVERDGALLGTGALNGENFFLEGTFAFTVAGDPTGQTYTGYQLEGAGPGGTDFFILPPGVPAGEATITGRTFVPSPNEIDYDALASGNETIAESTPSSLDLSGDDLIIAGDGDDSIASGSGFDTVSGGDGDDTITDTGDGGTFDGGDGDDSITITGAVTTVNVSGGADNDDVTIFNAVGSTNTVDLGDGNDTFTGGDAADTVSGGDGDDLISSGGGNDVLDGGAGDDTFNLFTGDDVVTGGLGNDTFVEGAGEGSDTITDFNVGNTGALDDGDQTNNDFVDLSAFYNTTTLNAVNAADGDPSNDFGNALALMRADAADGTLDGIIGNIDYSAEIGGIDLTLLDGSGGAVTGNDLTFDNTNVVCFVAGTLIKTPGGFSAIEQLSVGDKVITRDNGAQPIRWIAKRTLDEGTLRAYPNLLPICIEAGALGEGIPSRDLTVSPQHRIVVRSKIAIRMSDTDEVFIIAKHLLQLDGVSSRTDMTEVTYLHLMCDNHEVIEAEGAFAETMHTGPEALKAMTPEAIEELELIFGTLQLTPRPLARFVPKGKLAKRLVARHIKNDKAMYCL